MEHRDNNGVTDAPRALDGIRVLDIATMLAAPLTAALLGDFGADVIKVEHPRGDPQRHHGPSKDGVGLWWKTVARNKQCVTIDFHDEEGQEALRRLVAEADVLIENFRPGVMDRWNLGYDRLAELNPRLVVVKVTGFGQFGPYAGRTAFGTLAEAMSGFAYITGQKDGPPTLPPFGLADGIAGVTAAYATMLALFHRDRPGGSGRGQLIDLSLVEPLFNVVGAHPTYYDQLGYVQQRNGNSGSRNNAPRNTYLTSDDHWVAISTSAQSIAARCMTLVGHPEVIDEPWFAKGETRGQHAELLDGMVGEWIRERPLQEVLDRFAEAQVAIAPVYDASQIVEDPQLKALGSIITMDDPDLGPMKMQNVWFRMSDTPGQVRWTGRSLGADNDEVLVEHEPAGKAAAGD